jgi:hypothetical protein
MGMARRQPTGHPWLQLLLVCSYELNSYGALQQMEHMSTLAPVVGKVVGWILNDTQTHIEQLDGAPKAIASRTGDALIRYTSPVN